MRGHSVRFPQRSRHCGYHTNRTLDFLLGETREEIDFWLDNVLNDEDEDGDDGHERPVKV